jgi:hypothetical protein
MQMKFRTEVLGDEKGIPENDFNFKDSQSIYFVVIEWLHFQEIQNSKR